MAAVFKLREEEAMNYRASTIATSTMAVLQMISAAPVPSQDDLFCAPHGSTRTPPPSSPADPCLLTVAFPSLPGPCVDRVAVLLARCIVRVSDDKFKTHMTRLEAASLAKAKTPLTLSPASLRCVSVSQRWVSGGLRAGAFHRRAEQVEFTVRTRGAVLAKMKRMWYDREGGYDALSEALRRLLREEVYLERFPIAASLLSDAYTGASVLHRVDGHSRALHKRWQSWSFRTAVFASSVVILLLGFFEGALQRAFGGGRRRGRRRGGGEGWRETETERQRETETEAETETDAKCY